MAKKASSNQELVPQEDIDALDNLDKKFNEVLSTMSSVSSEARQLSLALKSQTSTFAELTKTMQGVNDLVKKYTSAEEEAKKISEERQKIIEANNRALAEQAKAIMEERKAAEAAVEADRESVRVQEELRKKRIESANSISALNARLADLKKHLDLSEMLKKVQDGSLKSSHAANEFNSALATTKSLAKDYDAALAEGKITADEHARATSELSTRQTELYSALDSVRTAQSESKKITDDAARAFDELSDRGKELTLAIQEQKEMLSKTKDAIKELETAYKSGSVGVDEYRERKAQLTALESDQKKTLDDLTRSLKKETKAMGEDATSLRGMEAALAKMRAEYEKMNKAQRESSEGRKLQKNINEQAKEVDSLRRSMGQAQQGVGFYDRALGGLTKGLKGIAGVFGLAGGAVALFKKTMSSTNDTGDVMRRTLAKVEAGTSYFFRTLASGDWSGFMTGMKRAINAADEYDRRMDEVGDKMRAVSVRESEYRVELAKLRNEMRDQTKTDEERIKSGEKLAEVELKILNERKRVLQDALDAEQGLVEGSFKLTADQMTVLVKQYDKLEKPIETIKELADAQDKLSRTSKETTKYILGQAQSVANDEYYDLYNKIVNIKKELSDFDIASMYSKELEGADEATRKIVEAEIEEMKTFMQSMGGLVGFADAWKEFGKVLDTNRDKYANIIVAISQQEQEYHTSRARSSATRSGLEREAINKRYASESALLKVQIDNQKEIMDSEKYSYNERLAAADRYYKLQEQAVDRDRAHKLNAGDGSDPTAINAVANAQLAKLAKEREETYKKMGITHEQVRLAEIDVERKANKVIIDDALKSFSDRIKASKEYEDQSVEIARGEFDAKTAVLNEDSDAYRTAYIELEAKLTEIAKSGSEERDRITSDEMRNRIEATSLAIRQASRNQSNEEVALAQQYANGLVNREQYERSKEEIAMRYERQSMQSTIDGLRNVLDTMELSDEDRLTAEKQLAEQEIALEKWKNDQIIKSEMETASLRAQIKEKSLELLQEGIGAVFTFASQASERRIGKIDEEIEALERQKEVELEYLEMSIVSEEDRETRRAAIDARYAARMAQLEAKKKEEQRKQAMYEKAQGLVSAIINTAIGVTNALNSKPVILAPILAATIAALGAVQIATIAAQPIPKYARGTLDHPGGLAVTGDAGRREAIITPSGKVYSTPAIPTVMDIPEHSVVLPDFRSLLPDARSVGRDNSSNLTATMIERIDTGQHSILSAIQDGNKYLREYIRAQLKTAATERYNSTLTATRRRLEES